MSALYCNDTEVLAMLSQADGEYKFPSYNNVYNVHGTLSVQKRYNGQPAGTNVTTHLGFNLSRVNDGTDDKLVASITDSPANVVVVASGGYPLATDFTVNITFDDTDVIDITIYMDGTLSVTVVNLTTVYDLLISVSGVTFT